MLRIVTVYPELLSTYGDGGNARVLADRAARRGLEVTLVDSSITDALDDGEIYLLGGGEDGPQRQAADALRRDGSLGSRVEDGAVVFAVCAGLQVLGTSFSVAGDDAYDGVGLLALETRRSPVRRVGHLLTRVGTHRLVGFENHGGVTTLSGCGPLGTVEKGFGNDGLGDGVRAGRVIGTYAHGPALALNPWLADELLMLVTGRELDPLPSVADRLHDERCALVAQG